MHLLQQQEAMYLTAVSLVQAEATAIPQQYTIACNPQLKQNIPHNKHLLQSCCQPGAASRRDSQCHCQLC